MYIIKVMWQVIYVLNTIPWNPHPFQRITFISDAWAAFSPKDFENTVKTTVVYHLSIQQVTKKY